MAVTILERPEGYVLGVTELAGVSFDFGGFFHVQTTLAHGLTMGDIVYIQSNIEGYNGFKKVGTVGGADVFEVESLGGESITFMQVVDLTVTPTISTHGWSAVHLPITYKLSNDLYPINTVDTTRNINSVQDANGYTVLQLSGSLGTVHSYDFVRINVPNDTDLNGVYQILEWISATVVLINLEYDSGNNFTGATALKHYNNYNILVRVYAGINASHQWASVKPYELAATLKFVPDDSNEAFFSINEILKSYIETRNNLVLGTLPNNTDFWNNFYIEVAESYDDSDGYTFGTFTSSFTSDQSTFEGTAVNADLEFKNIYSGSMSAYLMTNNTAKFLTLFTIPVLFQCGDDTPNCYSDVSWLNDDPSGAIISTFRKQYYLNGELHITVNDAVTESSGVIRTELEADCDYDRVDITLLGGVQLFDEPEFNATGNWQQTVTAPGSAWTISGGQASVSIPAAFGESEILFQSISGSLNYRFIAHITTTDGGLPNNDWNVTVFVRFFNGGTGGTEVLAQSVGTLLGASVGDVPELNIDTTFTVPGAFDTIGLYAGMAGGVTDPVTLHFEDSFIAEVDAQMSETKQFRIDCGCVNQEIRMTWLNNLGGFDYWAFTANKDHIREIQEAITTKKNILPTWPKSYGADSDTIRKQTKRVSNKAYTVRSQFLTSDEADALAYIKSSILVQIINSRTDRRTVIVDTDSFIVRQDGQDTFEVAFNISFTDDIPAQTV